MYEVYTQKLQAVCTQNLRTALQYFVEITFILITSKFYILTKIMGASLILSIHRSSTLQVHSFNMVFLNQHGI